MNKDPMKYVGIAAASAGILWLASLAWYAINV